MLLRQKKYWIYFQIIFCTAAAFGLLETKKKTLISGQKIKREAKEEEKKLSEKFCENENEENFVYE